MGYAETISTLALVTALGALAWNIVRDFISEKIALELNIAFGEVGNIRNSATGMFADAGSLIPSHKFDVPGMLVSITNTGRKPIGVDGVGGKYKNGNEFSIAIDGLPKMLQPYEVFSSMANAKLDFIHKIERDDLEDLWVRDTSKKKWRLSAKGWKRLKATANYIVSKKHL